MEAIEYCSLLNESLIAALVKTWLNEDIPGLDVGGFVVGLNAETTAIFAKEQGVLAGRPFANAVFKELGCCVDWCITDGQALSPGDRVATIAGPACKLLQGERLALNVLSRASGIATLAHQLRDMVKLKGWSGEVAATRKTTPGFRMVEKYAVIVGGCSTHRDNLSSMVMLKDNHIWSVGNITQAVQKARQCCGFSSKIEVECRSLDEGLEAARAGCDVVMLDNFTPEAAQRSAASLKDKFPRVIVEVSGGITNKNISDYMLPSVDVISTSSLTQGYQTVNFSMKILRPDRDPLNPVVTI